MGVAAWGQQHPFLCGSPRCLWLISYNTEETAPEEEPRPLLDASSSDLWRREAKRQPETSQPAAEENLL